MEPNVRLLRYFVGVADAGSFTRAAGRLYVSQPALSQQIRKLERDLGFALFYRDTREVRLTVEGEKLLPAARAIISAAEEFGRTAQSVAGGPHLLVLGFRAQAANELTPRILTRFARARPGVEVVLKQFPLAAIRAGLDTAESDLAILRLPVDLTGLDHLRILSEGRVAVLNDAHPLAGRAVLSLADLAGQPWIVTAADDPAWQSYARRPDHDAADAVVVDTVDEYLEAVVAGRGVALAPESATRFYTRPGIRYVPVIDAQESITALAWRAGTLAQNRTAAAFVDTVRQLVRESEVIVNS